MLPEQGEVIYDENIEMQDISVILSGDRNLYMKNTVYENMMYFCILKGMSEKKAKQIIEREKSKFIIFEQVRNKLVESLSYGQKRIVALMSAFVSGAKCIIIDEATDGLDVENTMLLRDIIRSISEDRIVVVVAHNLEFIKEVAGHLIFIKDGVCEKVLKNREDINVQEEYRVIYGNEK